MKAKRPGSHVREGSRTVTQREKADLWRARAAEPEIAAIIERAKRTFRGTYHDVMASGY